MTRFALSFVLMSASVAHAETAPPAPPVDASANDAIWNATRAYAACGQDVRCVKRALRALENAARAARLSVK